MMINQAFSPFSSFPENDAAGDLARPVLPDRSTRARGVILKALNDLGSSAGAAKISEMLMDSGIQLQERSVRFHLAKMDREGLTRCSGRHAGRQITEMGRKELARMKVMHKVGFIASKMDELGYCMSLDPRSGRGSVVANIIAIHKTDFSRSLHFMKPVFSSGYTMGDRFAVRIAGQRLGSTEVPRGKILLSTICSVTINGLFLKYGIPIVSRFGGLLEMDNGFPKRFTELIEYRATSIEPHLVFIRAGMTKVTQCAANGTGVVCAGFREFPAAALEPAKKLFSIMDRLNLRGVLAVGQPNRPLLDIPVGEGRVGMITIDGLNPIAVLQEAGIPVELNPLSGLEELDTFVSFSDIAPMGRRSTFVD